MGITFYNKTADPSQIHCDGITRVTLALSAAPDIQENPVDVVLVLDRSRSMTGQPLTYMKEGAKTFVHILSTATGGGPDGVIGGGSRIGIVSFSTTAVANTQLITSVATLDAAIDSLTADGSTNHADPFAKAIQLFDPQSSNRKIIVMFTDGNTTAGPDPEPVAAAAKADGAVIYCIGLDGSGGLDVAAINSWASDPSAAHVLITPDESELEELFAHLADSISEPGATNIVIDEIVNDDFTIVGLLPPDKGSAHMSDAHTIRWTIPELGVSGSEGAALQFDVQYIGGTAGVKEVNRSITYADDQGSEIHFPSPEVTVTCDTTFDPEPCPTPYDFTIAGCTDALTVDAGDVALSSQGRIVQLGLTLQNVCPGKRVALAVLLSETTCGGDPQPRGMKTFVIPAHSNPTCRDVTVRCIKFILPDSLADCAGCQCRARDLQVQCFAHYIDTDFVCCGERTDPPANTCTICPDAAR